MGSNRSYPVWLGLEDYLETYVLEKKPFPNLCLIEACKPEGRKLHVPFQLEEVQLMKITAATIGWKIFYYHKKVALPLS